MITGAMRMLFSDERTNLSPEDTAFRVLTLFYYYKHLGHDPTSYLGNRFCEEKLKPPRFSDDAVTDPIKCLLRWYNYKGFMELFRSKEFPQAMVNDAASLKRSSLISLSGQRQDLDDTDVNREERWSRLALLSTELVKDDQDFVEGLVWEVKRRLHERGRNVKLGNSPPWEFHCLNHSLPADFVIAKANLKVPQTTELRKAIMETLANCELFLQSDHSFLKSWNSRKEDSIRERWDFDCSSLVSTTILRLATKLKESDCMTNYSGMLIRKHNPFLMTSDLTVSL